MDVKITCRACERTFPLYMATDPENRPGHCAFCGEAMAFQYSGTFIETAEKVMALGTELERQLTLLAELAGGFALEPDSVIVPLQNATTLQDRLIAKPYESRWPPKPRQPAG